MRITLHIGPDRHSAQQVQTWFDHHRAALKDVGVLFPGSPGRGNHSRLFMAITDPDRVDMLRFNRGVITPAAQSKLRSRLIKSLDREIDATRPDHMVLSAVQLGSQIHRPEERARLKDLLQRWADDIRIIMHLRLPSEQLLAQYVWQLREGRASPLMRDLDLATANDWWNAALSERPDPAPMAGMFEEIQGSVYWLDYKRLLRFWEGSFTAIDICSADAALASLPEAFCTSLSIASETTAPPPTPSLQSLSRQRALNVEILRLLSKGTHVLPRKLWTALTREIAVDGTPATAAGLGFLDQRFAGDLNWLRQHFPRFDTRLPPVEYTKWEDADPGPGFRATQYLAAFLPRINKASKAEFAMRHQAMTTKTEALPLSDAAQNLFDKATMEMTAHLANSDLMPRIAPCKGDLLHPKAGFSPEPAKAVRGSTLVACMKDEAPFLLEWLAHHKAIGFENVLVFSNGCSDGTDQMLDRLQTLGHVVHRRNDEWKGSSPQNWALQQAQAEPVVRDARWIAHFDVDEFVNIRTGTGTLSDLLDALPAATHIAMTWRLFGAMGVDHLSDRLVLEQFDHCAPTYCPKPHTAWGFKTLFRNTGAYSRLSCHRPNKLDPVKASQVRWVNGSGQDITEDMRDSGWRSTRRSIGYDLVQLNHYALRGVEPFLVKRRRGRALHVGRQIGLDYWIRNDWNSQPEHSIKRGLPRLRKVLNEFLSDPILRALCDRGRAWHRQTARDLRAQHDFAALHQQVMASDLTDTERAAYCICRDQSPASTAALTGARNPVGGGGANKTAASMQPI